jgi:hypothetical protein
MKKVIGVAMLFVSVIGTAQISRLIEPINDKSENLKTYCFVVKKNDKVISRKYIALLSRKITYVHESDGKIIQVNEPTKPLELVSTNNLSDFVSQFDNLRHIFKEFEDETTHKVFWGTLNISSMDKYNADVHPIDDETKHWTKGKSYDYNADLSLKDIEGAIIDITSYKTKNNL